MSVCILCVIEKLNYKPPDDRDGLRIRICENTADNAIYYYTVQVQKTPVVRLIKKKKKERNRLIIIIIVHQHDAHNIKI